MGKRANYSKRARRRQVGVPALVSQAAAAKPAVPKVVYRRDFGDEPGMEAVHVIATDPFEELVRLRQGLLDQERLVAFWVAQARSAGLTWARVGEALGVSNQAACKRFGRMPSAAGVRSFRGL